MSSFRTATTRPPGVYKHTETLGKEMPSKLSSGSHLPNGCLHRWSPPPKSSHCQRRWPGHHTIPHVTTTGVLDMLQECSQWSDTFFWTCCCFSLVCRLVYVLGVDPGPVHRSQSHIPYFRLHLHGPPSILSPSLSHSGFLSLSQNNHTICFLCYSLTLSCILQQCEFWRFYQSPVFIPNPCFYTSL